MVIIAILLTVILEQRHLLDKARNIFSRQLSSYAEFFISRQVSTQRDIRYIYLFACIPVMAILVGLKLVIAHHYVMSYMLLKLIIFMLSVEILTWKEQAQLSNSLTNYSFIHTYAVNFFAALFWFLILPATVGVMCYSIINIISNQLKNKESDSAIYNEIVDKMLFYANVIPYFILFLFIAIAGNFEDVTHYLLEQRKKFSKSFFFLESTLKEIVLIAIGKEKFQISEDIHSQENLVEADLYTEKYYPKIKTYITAVLYRSSIFFVIIVAMISIARLIT